MNEDQEFLLAMLPEWSPERGFIEALTKDAFDKTSRSAYSDWLEDQGRVTDASKVRRGYTPGRGWVWSAALQPIASGAIHSGMIGIYHGASSGMLSIPFLGSVTSGAILSGGGFYQGILSDFVGVYSTPYQSG